MWEEHCLCTPRLLEKNRLHHTQQLSRILLLQLQRRLRAADRLHFHRSCTRAASVTRPLQQIEPRTTQQGRLSPLILLVPVVSCFFVGVRPPTSRLARIWRVRCHHLSASWPDSVPPGRVQIRGGRTGVDEAAVLKQVRRRRLLRRGWSVNKGIFRKPGWGQTGLKQAHRRLLRRRGWITSKGIFRRPGPGRSGVNTIVVATELKQAHWRRARSGWSLNKGIFCRASPWGCCYESS